MGKRFFYIWAENTPDNSQGVMPATLRRVDFRSPRQETKEYDGKAIAITNHSDIENLTSNKKRNKKYPGLINKTSKAWIMVGYGICLNADCGDR